MSDKQYKITLTEKQFDLIGKAVEMMLRTGIGQTYALTEWLTLAGNDPSGDDFNMYIAQRDIIGGILDGIIRERRTQKESDAVRELQTIYAAIAHRQWMDNSMDKCDVRSHKPVMRGNEPVPKIERTDG